MSEDNEDVNKIELQFLIWLQYSKGIYNMEKYDELSMEDYIRLKMEFLELLSDSAVIDLGGFREWV